MVADTQREAIKERILDKMQESVKSFPYYVIETLKRIQDPQSNASDISEPLSHDQGLVLRVLKLANSAALGTVRHVNNITEAIAYLGLKNVRNIVMTASVYSMMDKDIAGYSLDKGELWHHSAAVSCAAKFIAAKTGKCSPEDAYLCGMLHDIGKLVLNDYVKFGYALIQKMVEGDDVPFVEAETKVLGFHHGIIGSLLLEKWAIPTPFCVIAEYHHHPDTLPEEHKKVQTLLDVVHVANVLSLMLGYGMGSDSFQNRMSNESVERLGIVDMETLMQEISVKIEESFVDTSTLEADMS